MLCSYFMSKLYLKLTCFCSFVFCFYIEPDLFFYFQNELGLFFCLLCDPLATVAVYLVVKSFLLVSSCAIKFLCGLLENVKKDKKKQQKKAISAPT